MILGITVSGFLVRVILVHGITGGRKRRVIFMQNAGCGLSYFGHKCQVVVELSGRKIKVLLQKDQFPFVTCFLGSILGEGQR